MTKIDCIGLKRGQTVSIEEFGRVDQYRLLRPAREVFYWEAMLLTGGRFAGQIEVIDIRRAVTA